MRIIIRFSENKELVPINNQSYINYYVNKKCLGDNNKYHDSKSDYCISSLQGGKLTDDRKHLEFKNGGFIAITSNNETFLDDLVDGIINNPKLNWGMEYMGIEFIKENFIDGINHFSTLCPFIIKKKKYNSNKKYTFSTLNDSDFVESVQNHLIRKINKIYPDIDTTDVKLMINEHPSHKVKNIMIKNVKNKANQCQISILCSKRIAEIIYNIGIGQSTGSGFGTIYKTENHNKYRN